MLADMAMVEAARCLVYECARIADEGFASDASFREFSAKASMAKCFASDMAMKVTTDAVQIFGTNRIHRLIVARQLLFLALLRIDNLVTQHERGEQGLHLVQRLRRALCSATWTIVTVAMLPWLPWGPT